MASESYTFASSSSDSQSNTRPDRPLLIKCDYNSRKKKVSFESARNCTFDRLAHRVGKAFQLHIFRIKWTDDDNEENYIESDEELNDAIQFYCKGDDATTSTSASSLSYRSILSKNKITMEIQIDIPYYDGPALSDSSSLASFEDDRHGTSNSISLPLDGSMSGPQDDDAVTISSHDPGYRQAARSKPDTLFKKIIARSARSASRTFQHPARSLSRSSDAAASDVQSAITLSADQNPSSVEGQSSRGASARYPTDPSAVFERLRLEDEPTNSLTPQHSMMWIQDQSERLRKIRLGPLHEPSEADTFSLNTDNPSSDDAENRLSLQVDHRGIERYYLWSGGSESSRGAGADDRNSASYEASQSEGPSRSRPVSMSTEESAGRPSSGYPAFSETSPPRPSFSQSSSEPMVYTLDQSNGQWSIPPDLLVPPEVTACSECNTILDSMRYVCTTCGEKTPASREELEADLVAGKDKGKGKAFGADVYARNGSASSIFTYPPHAHQSSPHLPGGTIPGLDQKPLPETPSVSPTLVAGSSNYSSPSQSNSRSGSSSSTHLPGYELCHICIQKSGVDHSLSLSLWDGTLRRDHDSLPSPEELSARRRSAPKQRGQLRHAYREKMWGFSGWEDIQQDERAISRCSACNISLSNNRYKCVSCDCYVICRACYGDVHNVHPIHAFLTMSDKLVRSQSAPEMTGEIWTFDAADEPSLKHEGVQCSYCKQDVIGARYHCIECEDVDICGNCEVAGTAEPLDSPSGGHTSSHKMLKLPLPLKQTEVARVATLARDAQTVNGRSEVDILSALHRSSPGSASSSFRTVGMENMNSSDHLVICNSCSKPVIGIRYQCVSCPSKPNSYNLCEACEIRSHKVHDPMHVFVKLRRPVDNRSPLESEFPIIPTIYKNPVGRRSSISSNVDDPQEYLNDLLHTSAYCDRHMQPIVGKWYRCMYCEKDLCEECEDIDEHDNTHIYLVFKAIVNMHSFKHLIDGGNPQGSAPVLTEPVYFPC